MNGKLKKLYIELINTGERPVTETMFEDIEPIFQCAYSMASDNISNKSVLDIGCGGGYGTEYLSRFTDKPVIGFDIDKNTIKTNSDFYNKKNLQFTYDPKKLQSYDVVTSFQVIEHFPEKLLDQYLSQISNEYLKKGGTFFCSTPNKLITSPELEKPVMVFHIKEFTPQDFKELLIKYFKKVEIFGQYREDGIELQRAQLDPKTLPFRAKVIRAISQNEFVRVVSRHLPMFIKYIFMGRPDSSSPLKYKITNKSHEIGLCQTIIARCEN